MADSVHITSETEPHATSAFEPSALRIGIDVGSTTTKAVVSDPATGEILFSSYERHSAHQAESVIELLDAIEDAVGNRAVNVAVCGSGGEAIALLLDVPYVQEVVANSLAIRALYPKTRTAIELGGQDAKVIFFSEDEQTGEPEVSDMRMNGSCAGGTGAFVDEIASLLKVDTSDFNALAEQGSVVYDISGRCGVYAKTDIQPLLNQGAAREDIALSSLHAIAKQTIGGLAQGLDIVAPVIFEGGPLTFNPRLIEVFSSRLELGEDDMIIPKHPELMMARGASMAIDTLFPDSPARTLEELRRALASGEASVLKDDAALAAPLFGSEEERAAFNERHGIDPTSNETGANAPGVHIYPEKVAEKGVVKGFLGIDSGSTTTKFAVIDEHGELISEFYASNGGEPLDVCRDALIELRDAWRDAGYELEIISMGSTGYGELLFASGFGADVHVVETVAHAYAARELAPDVSFILDIGGQDMKAIWVDNGIITDIMVNEACSSGCGSFLENFASSLGIPMRSIAHEAFSSRVPATLGSRCTVFMNSSIVSEQRKGRTSADIMAGLCRSIIENVFTKVVRLSNFDSLGPSIVVQGGTFANDAVLRALEVKIGREVVRAPHAGLMGAIGIALMTKARCEEKGLAARNTRFIGLDNLESFGYVTRANMRCPFCSNHCNRTFVTFENGATRVTGNRCERGSVIGDLKDEEVRAQLRHINAELNSTPNLFKLRGLLLFEDYDAPLVCAEKDITIGLPRVLAFWDDMPFWSTLFRSLGFKVKFSSLSTREMYESGLGGVVSDTVCFPAKLVHGHIRDLVAKKVDRIFMPIVTTVPSENRAETSESMCAVVKGYSMVVRNSDNPQKRWGVTFDDPLFHWYSEKDRARQLCAYFAREYGISKQAVKAALEAALAAMGSFRSRLLAAGAEAIEEAGANDTYAVVLASRPYHNDPLVNHNLPGMLAEMGIAVLPPDAVPGVDDVDLSNSRIDIVNNFHARMLGSAVLAARSDDLEYIQLVSFGCGHDAYLSDEIVRLMKEVGNKSPLILKLDESDISGPLRIRVRSFIETVDERRGLAEEHTINRIADPYPVKYVEADHREKVILVPNTSHAFARLMSAALSKQGVRVEALDMGGAEAIALGKKYVHNDICFPAQMTVGEALAALESGKYNEADVAIGTGKYIGDCRLTHYAALLRKALDDAGYSQVPIITNDDVDAHNIHPGLRFSLGTDIRMVYGLPMIDVLEELLRKMRPYELVEGSADAAFEEALDALIAGFESGGVRGGKAGFRRAIGILKKVEYDRSELKPTVLIVGEYLLNFHPGANHDIERYLERNGMEVIEARMTDVIRKTYFYKKSQKREFNVDRPFKENAWYEVADALFDRAHAATEKIAAAHPLHERTVPMLELVHASDPIMHHTFDAGEGVLIPAEILHNAEHGCRAFVILQPFGCLPNHVCGRGVSKRLKELYPDAQILPLDYDPDVSFGNIENRLQMLIMNARMKHEAERSDGE